MAPKSARRASISRAKQNASTRRTKRVFTRPMSNGSDITSEITSADVTPSDPIHFLEDRQFFSGAISLGSLIRLDWSHRQDFFSHGPGATRLERFGFKGQSYSIESLDPGASDRSFIYLFSDYRYSIVPIFEKGELLDTPKRFLLVRSEGNIDEPGTHFFVVERFVTPSEREPYAYLYVANGQDDSVMNTPLLRIAGIVEAVLEKMEAESPYSTAV